MNLLRARETAHDFTRPAAAMPTSFDFPCTKGPQFYDFAAATSTAAFKPKCAPPEFSKYWWDGVGYYSPAVCPAGYTVGCTRFDKNQGPPVEKTETAMQCVPSGFTCGANPSFVTAGATTAVMIQIRWAQTDLTNLATHPIVPGASPMDESVYIPFDLRDERPKPKDAMITGHNELKRGPGGIYVMGKWFQNEEAADNEKRQVSGSFTRSSSSSTTTSRSPITTTPAPDPFDRNPGLGAGAIAGIVVGVVAGLAILGGIIFWIIRLSRQKKAGSQQPPPMMTASSYPPGPMGPMQPQYMPELHGQQNLAVPPPAMAPLGSMTVSSVSPGTTAASMSQQGTPLPAYLKHEQQQNQVPHTGIYAPVKPAASPQPNPTAELDVVRAESYPAELSEQTRRFEMQTSPPERPIPELGTYSPGPQPPVPAVLAPGPAQQPTSSIPPPWAADPMSPTMHWNVPDVVGAPSFVGNQSRVQSYVTAASTPPTGQSPAPPSIVSQPSTMGQAQPSQWAPPPPVPSPGAQGQDIERMRAESAQLEEQQRQLQARIAAAQGGQPGPSAS